MYLPVFFSASVRKQNPKKYLLELIRRRSKNNEKNMSREHGLDLDQK